ncbi:DUF6376 family protein [Planococcus lenghuensis]|uniref:Lipoprotein n=1 Tax=Planococcus lenghuensis TaxID=2213202 RepID=A0A1Q2L0R2_9BACL|nr:DUF6376 family protein [Planococcus lenghuensis]AQQ54050.1 hypothetical protein B0X71_13700 [Planococcus lenghuensis]
MKKITAALFILTASSLTGCGGEEESVETTVTYENESLEFEEAANDFVEEVPPLLNEAVTDEDAAAELETYLESMRRNIIEFNAIQEPEVGADLHADVVALNEEALEGIETFQASIEEDTLDAAAAEETTIFQTLSAVVDILDEIQALEEEA